MVMWNWISNAVVLAFSAAFVIGFLSDRLQPQVRATLHVLNWPLRRNYLAFKDVLALEGSDPVARYGRYLGLLVLALAAVALLPSFWWLPPAILALAASLAVVTGWSENEDQRSRIRLGEEHASPDALADLRDEAVVAGLALFPIFGLALFRTSPWLGAFVGDAGAGPVMWLLFVLDQFLSAVTFDIAQIAGWQGLSSIRIDETVEGAFLDRAAVLLVKITMSALFIGTIVRMIDIRQSIKNAVDNFDHLPEPVLRLGKRAKRALDEHLAAATPPPKGGSSDVVSAQLCADLLAYAASYELPRATRAMRALTKLRQASALPVAQKKMTQYLSGRRWRESGGLSRLAASLTGDARTSLPEAALVDDILASVEAFAALTQDLVQRTGQIPELDDGLWHVLPGDVFHASGPFPDARVRIAVARIAVAMGGAEHKWQVTFLHDLSRAIAVEPEPEVLAEILDSLRLAGAPEAATRDAIAARYGDSPQVDGLLRRFVLLSGGLAAAPPPLVEDLLRTDDVQQVQDLALMIQLSRSDAYVKAAAAHLEHEDWIVRSRLSDYLRTCADPLSVPALEQALANPDVPNTDKSEYVKALTAIGGEDVERILIDVLGQDLGMASEFAVHGLTELNCRRAIPLLIERLDRPIANLSFDSVPLVAEALGKLGAEEAVQPMCRLLTATLTQPPSRGAPARALALAKALARIGDPSARAALDAWRAAGGAWKKRTLYGLDEMTAHLEAFDSRTAE